jgi:hypothetical protein
LRFKIHQKNSRFCFFAVSSGSELDSDNESIEAEKEVVLKNPLMVEGRQFTVLDGDRAGALLYKTVVIDGQEYNLFDDCFILADEAEGSKPPYVAKIVAIGQGGKHHKVSTFVTFPGLRLVFTSRKQFVKIFPS